MLFNTSFFACNRNYSLVATIFYKSLVDGAQADSMSCVNKPISSVKPMYCRKKIKMLFTGLGRSVWEKTVPLVLSTALGLRPETSGTVFSHTDLPPGK